MSRPIQVKFDNSLEDIEVIKPLLPSSVEEGGAADTSVSEIKITGTFTPLVKFNDKTLPWDAITGMRLECTEFLPKLSLSFIDVAGSTMMLDTPGPDNIVVIEILPRFDKIYKKIKLKFYVDDIRYNKDNNEIRVSCTYNCPGLNDCNIESFGKITTYKFFEQVAQRLKLGLCTNLDDSGDERWIYMDSTTWLESMIKESKCGGTSEYVLDSWIDLWNNINLVDMKDLFCGDPDNNLQVYVMTNFIDVDAKNDQEPQLADAIITNDYRLQGNPLYTPDIITLSNNKMNIHKGTDRAINIFDLNGIINQSLLIQDGTGVKNDVFTKFYYNGEYNALDNDGTYLFQPELVSALRGKISNNIVSVTLSQPCLGLMRGGKVNLEWYDTSNYNVDLYKKCNTIESNIPLEPNSNEDEMDFDKPGSILLNRKLSGQYLIIGTVINYNRIQTEGGPTVNMTQEFILSKPVQTFNYSDALKEG